MSSKRHVRRKACEGKRREGMRLEAAVAAAGAQQRTRDVLNAYRCRFCGGWHIGHPPAAIQNKLEP